MPWLTIAWPFVKANWKALSLAGLVLGAYLWHKWEVRTAYQHGREAVLLEQKAEAARRNNDAETANAASAECQRNPACRLRDDGWRRPD